MKVTIALLACVFLVLASPLQAGDKLTEQNMTQKDYDEITKVDLAGVGKPAPDPVHDLTDAGVKAVKEAGGVRVLKGKDWKKMSPAERGQAIKNIYSTSPDGSGIFIEVPSGNVWIIDYRKAAWKLRRDKLILPWETAEKEALPKTVKGDAGNGQEDRRGTIKLMDLKFDY